MKLFIDSADKEKIKKAFEYFPLAGVTTNPTIIARDIGGGNVGELLKDIREISKGKLMFVQVTSSEAGEMLRDAAAIRDFLGGNLSVKIPACAEGIKAIGLLKKEGINSTATAVYTVSQALEAAEAGAEFVAPYISHIDNLGLDGPAVAAEMSFTLKKHAYDCEVLGASFRTASQVTRLFESGVAAATVTAEMLVTLTEHPGTRDEIASFERNWKNRFGNEGIRSLIGK